MFLEHWTLIDFGAENAFHRRVVGGGGGRGATTLSITTFIITTLSITRFSKTTLSIMIFSTLKNKCDTQHNG